MQIRICDDFGFLLDTLLIHNVDLEDVKLSLNDLEFKCKKKVVTDGL